MSRAERSQGGGRPPAAAPAIPAPAPPVLDAPAPGAAAGTGPAERTARFVELSAFLTGYSRVELAGTGLIGTYLRTVDSVLPQGMLDELLGAFGRRPRAAGPDRDVAAVEAILDDPRLGPVARNLILLWYCGTWTALPEDWRAAYGASPLDTSRVVSAQSYQGGLQWAAAGAHPAGARQQGFGAWAQAPQGSRG